MRKLITVEEAKSILESLRIPTEVREVSLLDSLNKFSAENVFSPMDLPPFNRSTRDGYAVISEDVLLASEESPVRLKVIDSIEAGESKRVKLSKGCCVKVATGAILPENSDAVVMVENAGEEGGIAIVKKAVSPKENIMLRGADIGEGELVLREGERITPEKVCLLSGLGIEKVKIRDVKIGVFSTGNEIVPPGESLDFGKIYDVNGFGIVSFLRNAGFSADFLGILRDDVGEMERNLLEASKEYSVVITSGATSAGERDLLVEAVKRLGEVVFHGVRIKPGKPFLVAKISKAVLFGLPGFPVSALTILHEFVKPVLLRAVGAKEREKKFEGVVAKRIYSEGRRELLPVVLAGGRIFPIEKGSGAITSLTNASGYLEIKENEEVIERGEKRVVKVFSETYDVVVAGLDVLKLLNGAYFLTSNIDLAKAEYALGNVDLAVVPGEETTVKFLFVGREGRTGCVEGYGIRAEITFRDHFQLFYSLKKGKIDGGFFAKPFTRFFNLKGEISEEVKVDVLTRREDLKERVSKLLSL